MPGGDQSLTSEQGRRDAGVSIKDVARRASVSIATVSRVLNNPGMVAPSTAERVQSAIDQLRYRPNRFAQGLVTRRSRVIGISLPDLHGEFYAELMHRADNRAEELGYHLLVSSGAHRPSSAAPSGVALDLMDGLVTMVTEDDVSDLDRLVTLGLPVAVLGAPVGDRRLDSITIDNRAGAREAAEHLLAGTPAARCWFVGGHRGNIDSDERASAFERVLHGVGVDDPTAHVCRGEFTVEWGRVWAEGMIRAGALHGSGVLAGNDEIAVGIVDAARDAGISVPEGLRIVGFDDSRLCAMLRPTLSSVRVPIREAGIAAVDAVIRRLGDSDSVPVRRTFTTSLVVRDSSRIVR